MSIDTATMLLLQFDGDQSDYKQEVVMGGSSNFFYYEGSVFSGPHFSFNGTYLNVPSMAGLNLNTDEWTIEFWYRRRTHQSANYIFGVGNGPSTGSYAIRFNLNYKTLYQVTSNGSSTGSISSELGDSYDVWRHICMENRGGLIHCYLDGTSEGTTTIMPQNLTNFYFGAWPGGSKTSGENPMDEIRVSNIARYGGNFTPHTEPFENDANTVFLCRASGDKSTTPKEIIPYSGPKLTSAHSKFHGAMYFNAEDYLEIPPHTNLLIGNYYTIDFWAYLIGDRDHIIYYGRQGGSGDPCAMICPYRKLYAANGYIRNSAGTMREYTHTNSPLNQWFHYALVKNGNEILVFVNGSVVTSTDMAGLDAWTSTGGVNIGHPGAATGDTYAMVGYLDEFRISNVARWTSNFTPPTTDWSRFGYGISGEVGSPTRITCITENNYQVIDSRVVQAGDYSINLGTTDDLIVIGQPENESLAPVTHVGVTPVLI